MYLEYHDLMKKYKEAERRYNESLEERSKIILAVLPKASQFKEVVTFGGSTSPDAKIIDYTSEIDEIDKLVNQSRNTRDMLNYELKKLETKMREHGDIYDRIYVYKWLDGRKPKHFNRLIGFSLSRTYDYITEIKNNLYINSKSEKIGKF